MTFLCCEDHLIEALTYEAKQLQSYKAKTATITVGEHTTTKCQVCGKPSKYMVSLGTYEV